MNAKLAWVSYIFIDLLYCVNSTIDGDIIQFFLAIFVLKLKACTNLDSDNSSICLLPKLPNPILKCLRILQNPRRKLGQDFSYYF